MGVTFWPVSSESKGPSRGQALGWAVRDLRLERDIKQGQLAREANLDPSWLSRIETGKVANPRFSTLDGLAAVLGVTTEDLVGRVKRYQSGDLTPTANRRVRSKP